MERTRARGISSIDIDATSSRLVASYVDGALALFDVVTAGREVGSTCRHPVREWTGYRQSTTFYVQTVMSPDGQFVLTGSIENNAYIWDLAINRFVLS